MKSETLPRVLRAFKALADESRLRILGLLWSRERSVDELARLLVLNHARYSDEVRRGLHDRERWRDDVDDDHDAD